MTNIRVALRVRPLSQREVEGNYPVVVSVESNSAFITDIRVPVRPSADSRQRFRQFDFDHTFWFSSGKASASQVEIYREMGPHLEKAIFAGYNACLLAYGQSGSGKTHTMIGTREDPGIIPRLCHSLWEKLHSTYPTTPSGEKGFQMEVSFLEIYREKVRDLLNPEKSLKLREHPQLGPHVQGLTRLEVTGDSESLLHLLWEGERRRATGNTNSNRRSSRSHAIWTLYLTIYSKDKQFEQEQEGCSSNDNQRSRMRKGVITNQVHLVDLAGSEKADCKTAKSLLAEGADINRSLVALGNVISALAEKAQYVPYRDSALTWLLKDSIGGNASTSIIITASPSSNCHVQTLNSLRFAARARLVQNKPKINQSISHSSLTGPYGPYCYVMELKKDISRLAKIIKAAQTNGGILRGLAPRGGLTRLIHAIEGIGQAEKEQLRLQRERACSEDTTATSSSLQGTSTSKEGSCTPSSSGTGATLTQAKSLNDVMVQHDIEKRSALHNLRRRKSRQSESALGTLGKGKSGGDGDVAAGTSNSSPTQSPHKIVGTEVFIPTSNSYKCLTWQQEETHPVPKPVGSSNSSLLSIEDVEEGDLTATALQSSSNSQIHHLKYMLEVNYPVTHNLDHASRISERIHGNLSEETYQNLLPTLVMENMEDPVPLVNDIIPTLVNSRDISEEVKSEEVEEVGDDEHLNRKILKSRSVLVGHRAKEEKEYLFPTKCKHFASPVKGLQISPFESSDEMEFLEPENIERMSKCRAIHSHVTKALERTLLDDNTFEDTCYFTAGESILSQLPNMVISTSSSSYESINMPDSVKPVNLIRDFSQFSDDFMLDEVDDLEIENEVFHDDFQAPKANVCMVPGYPMDTAVPIEILITDPVDNPPLNNPINGVSDSKFRNYFAKELHQMERMGKQIKTLLQMTQRYNVVKPYLDEISNLQNSDHSKPDPKLDAHIDSCSGWNVDIELAKVHQEIHSLNKVLKTGLGPSGMVASNSQSLNKVPISGRIGGKTSSTSTMNNESDSSLDVDGYYSGYAQMRQIPLLSGNRGNLSHSHNQVPGGSDKLNKSDLKKNVKRNSNCNTLYHPTAKGSKSQPNMSGSSSNHDSFNSHNAIPPSTNKNFTPNFHSTPMRKLGFNHGGGCGDITTGSDIEEEQLYGMRPPVSVSQSSSVSSFRPVHGTSSLQTYYRNMNTTSASTHNHNQNQIGMGPLQYCPSNSNMSSVSSNASQSLNYDSLNSYGVHSDLGYPLNISNSEPRKFSSAYMQGHGHSHSHSHSQASSKPSKYLNLRGSESSTDVHPYTSRQNSFNSEEIRSHRKMFEGGSFTKFPRGSGEFSEYSGYFYGERNGRDSMDLCSCGDSNSKYSTDQGSGSGLPFNSLEKSSSRSQFSNFGGSTTTEGSDYPGLPGTGSGSGRQNIFPKTYSSSQSHHHLNNDNSLSVTGLPPQYPNPNSRSLYKNTKIKRNDNF